MPPGIRLGKIGRAWWRWVWRTPMAAGWAAGHEALVARRASLEDDLDALGEVDGSLNLAEMLEITDRKERLRELEWIVGTLKRMAGGKIAIFKEMRELDDRLGLNPKAMAALRWQIVTAVETISQEPAKEQSPAVANLEARRQRLKADAS